MDFNTVLLRDKSWHGQRIVFPWRTTANELHFADRHSLEEAALETITFDRTTRLRLNSSVDESEYPRHENTFRCESTVLVED